MSKPVPSTALEELSTLNILVMVEDGPQSDTYQQLALTPAQFEELMDILNTFVTPVDDEVFYVPCTEDEPVTIPNRNSHVFPEPK